MTHRYCIVQSIKWFFAKNIRVPFTNAQSGRFNFSKSIIVSCIGNNDNRTERKCNDNKITGRGVYVFNDELFINIEKIIAYFSLDLEINH